MKPLAIAFVVLLSGAMLLAVLPASGTDSLPGLAARSLDALDSTLADLGERLRRFAEEGSLAARANRALGRWTGGFFREGGRSIAGVAREVGGGVTRSTCAALEGAGIGDNRGLRACDAARRRPTPAPTAIR